jgi:hypothetical protein
MARETHLEVALFPRLPLGVGPVVGSSFAAQVGGRDAFRGHEFTNLRWATKKKKDIFLKYKRQKLKRLKMLNSSL